MIILNGIGVSEGVAIADLYYLEKENLSVIELDNQNSEV